MDISNCGHFQKKKRTALMSPPTFFKKSRELLFKLLESESDMDRLIYRQTESKGCDRR